MPDQPRIFNGGYTLTGPKGHVFVRIRTKLKAWSGWEEGDRYIELQNGQHWEKFGRVEDAGIHVFQYCHRQRTANNPCLNVYDAVAEILMDLLTVPEMLSRYRPMGYTYICHATCLRCNRVLKDEVSIARGLGPECAGKGRRTPRELEPDVDIHDIDPHGLIQADLH